MLRNPWRIRGPLFTLPLHPRFVVRINSVTMTVDWPKSVTREIWPSAKLVCETLQTLRVESLGAGQTIEIIDGGVCLKVNSVLIADTWTWTVDQSAPLIVSPKRSLADVVVGMDRNIVDFGLIFIQMAKLRLSSDDLNFHIQTGGNGGRPSFVIEYKNQMFKFMTMLNDDSALSVVCPNHVIAMSLSATAVAGRVHQHSDIINTKVQYIWRILSTIETTIDAYLALT